MPRTFNRTPLSIATPNKNDVVDRFFNHYEWKGLNDDRNYLGVDQQTFQDCNNVYVDSEGLLRSRPALKSYKPLNDTIVDVAVYDDYVVYTTLDNMEHYNLVFEDGTTQIVPSYTLYSNEYKLVLAERKLFIFEPNGLHCFDMDSKIISDAADFVYVPTTTIVNNGVVTDGESPNELTTSYITRYVYEDPSSIDFIPLAGKEAVVTIDNKKYNITFVPNNQIVFVQAYSNLDNTSIADDYILGINGKSYPFVERSDRGTIISTYSYVLDSNNVPDVNWNIYYYPIETGVAGKVPSIKGILGKPIISENGEFAIVLLADGPYKYSLLNGGEWTKIVTGLSNLNLNEHLDYCENFNQTTSVNGHFVDDLNYGFVYGSNLDETVTDRLVYKTLNYVYAVDGTVSAGTIFSSSTDPVYTDISRNEPYNVSIADKAEEVIDQGGTYHQVIRNSYFGWTVYPCEYTDGIDTFYVQFRFNLDGYIKGITATYNYDIKCSVIDANGDTKVTYSVSEQEIESFDETSQEMATEPIFKNISLSAPDDSRTLDFTVMFYRSGKTGTHLNYGGALYLEDITLTMTATQEAPSTIAYPVRPSTVDYYCTSGHMPNVSFAVSGGVPILSVQQVVKSLSSTRELYNSLLITVTNNGEADATNMQPLFGNLYYWDVPSPINSSLYRSPGVLRIAYTMFNDDKVYTVYGVQIGTEAVSETTISEVSVDDTHDVTTQRALLQKNLEYLLTNDKLYNLTDGTYIDLLFSAKPVSLDLDAAVNITVYSNGRLYSSKDISKVTTDMLTEGEINYFVPECVTELHDFYFSLDKTLYISSYSYDDEDTFKWYFPKKRTEVFDYSITGLQPISANEVAIFQESQIYYVTWSDDNVPYYYKSKVQVGLPEGGDVLTTYDGKYVVFCTRRGVVALTYQEFVATTEQNLTYLSDNMYGIYRDYIRDGAGIKLFKYSFWLVFYKEQSNKLFLFDTRNSSWWPISINNNCRKLIDFNNSVRLLTDNGCMNMLSTIDDSYYDEDTQRHKIDWHLLSQKLYLDAINYYKHIVNLTLVSVHEGTNSLDNEYNITDMDYKLQIACYRKIVNSNINELDYISIDYNITPARTFVQRVNFSKVCAFQYKLSNNADNAEDRPLSLNNITVKYRIGTEVR